MKHCDTCTCTQPTRENQSKNGVRVIVYRWPDGSTTVDASCQCYGMPMRIHDNPFCKNIGN